MINPSGIGFLRSGFLSILAIAIRGKKRCLTKRAAGGSITIDVTGKSNRNFRILNNHPREFIQGKLEILEPRVVTTTAPQWKGK